MVRVEQQCGVTRGPGDLKLLLLLKVGRKINCKGYQLALAERKNLWVKIKLKLATYFT